jgi:hypothetical protein
MSSGSIFDSENNNSSNKTSYLIALVLILLILGAGFGIYWANRPVLKTKAERIDENIRNSTVMMLAQPMFSGEEFRQQVLGKARLERLNVKTRDVYFSLPELNQPELDESLDRFIADKTKVEFAQDIGGKMKVGELTLRKSPQQACFLKTSLDNVKVDLNTTLKFPYQRATYSLNLNEMEDFINNSRIYGGKLSAETTLKKGGRNFIFANHGSMVAKPDEPSLQRLVAELLKDESIGNDREKRIQRLVDFVSNEIEYSYTEALSLNETLKRPDEVLLTRTADCSNKTILLASLLEQIGEDYILLYCPQHITVAVPRGNFPNDNKLDFTWEGKEWLIAESTLPGFVVGKTMVKDSIRLLSVEYVQRPREKEVIFDADNYSALAFR